jgi:hypothetical protein
MAGNNAVNITDGLLIDFAWGLLDTAGNLAVGLDNYGTLISGALNTGTLTPVAISLGGDQLSVEHAPALPDLLAPVMDASGNVVSGYGYDGSFNVVSLVSQQPITVAGNTFSGQSVPSDCLDVRNAAYGAVGDAVENFCIAQVTSSNTLRIHNFSGPITLEQQTPTTALLTIAAVRDSGIAFQPYNAGQQLYLSCGGYALTAQVLKYIDGSNVVIAASGVTTITAQAGTVLCPCFVAANAGGSLVFDGMGQERIWPNSGTIPAADTTLPYGTIAFPTTIQTVSAPDTVVITGSFPYPWDGPARLWWGTNDANAVALAGEAAFNAHSRKVHFSGDGRTYLMVGMLASGDSRQAYVPTIATEAGAAFNGVIWQGDNVKSFAFDAGGLPIFKRVAPIGSDQTRLGDRMIFGRGTLRRCNQLTSINLFITGDSQGTTNPQNQAAAMYQVQKFIEEFVRANPGKTIRIYQMAIGAATYDAMADPNLLLSNAAAVLDGWTVPRPVAGAHSWMAFMLNANQTGVGPPICPDCIAIFDNGSNDANNINATAMWSVINQLRQVNRGDAFGPPDILLQTDHAGMIMTTSKGHGGGVPIPDPLSGTHYVEYATGLIRSTAVRNGFGCIDFCTLVNRAIYGYDEQHRALRQVPSLARTASPSAPLQIPYRCRDLTTRISLPGSGDGEVWAAMRQLDLQISPNPGGKLMMRLGKNGNLWVGVSSYGAFTPTTCTIDSGSTLLTVGAPTRLADQTLTIKLFWRMLDISGGLFTPSMVGQCLVGPLAREQAGSRQPQRTFIRSYVGPNDVILHDWAAGTAVGGRIIDLAGQTLTVGGIQFIPMDSTAQPDVVIIFPDGTIWNTQVAGGGYVSATQATLAAAAPQGLSAQTVSAFIGRMGVKWFDTGIMLAGQSGTDLFEVDVNRCTLMLGFQSAAQTLPAMVVNTPIERFGGTFYPVLTPAATQAVELFDMWIDEDRPFAPTTTPWELRGIADGISGYYLGGAAEHPSSRLRTDVVDAFFANQDLCSW